jgi:hypothetical protein
LSMKPSSNSMSLLTIVWAPWEFGYSRIPFALQLLDHLLEVGISRFARSCRSPRRWYLDATVAAGRAASYALAVSAAAPIPLDPCV